MDSFLHWGIDLITAIQQFNGPAPVAFFRAVSFMGQEEFYLAVLPFIFWNVNFRLGARLVALLLLSTWLNLNLKDLFQQPRPYELDPGVLIVTEDSYGMPSNHAQAAAVLWGGIACGWRKRWLWITAAVLVLLIGFSRIYLGVHFPADVLAGWAIGGVLLALFLLFEPAVLRWLAGLKLWLQILLAVAVPAGLLAVHPVDDITAAMGTLAGAGAGLALTRRFLSYRAGGSWRFMAVKYVAGLAVMLGIYLGLKAVFPDEGSSLYTVFRFLRYGLIGLWAAFGAPWLFRKIEPVIEQDG